MVRHLLALTVLLSLTGCASRSPLMGSIYTGVIAGEAATAQTGSKEGSACAISILSLFAFGDASIDTAKKNGGIVSVSTVDGKTTNILGLYGQYCTVVRGK